MVATRKHGGGHLLFNRHAKGQKAGAIEQRIAFNKLRREFVRNNASVEPSYTEELLMRRIATLSIVALKLDAAIGLDDFSVLSRYQTVTRDMQRLIVQLNGGRQVDTEHPDLLHEHLTQKRKTQGKAGRRSREGG